MQSNLAVFSVLPSRARYVIHGLIAAEPARTMVSDRNLVYANVHVGNREVYWSR